MMARSWKNMHAHPRHKRRGVNYIMAYEVDLHVSLTLDWTSSIYFGAFGLSYFGILL
jgi:hypothetical protein